MGKMVRIGWPAMAKPHPIRPRRCMNSGKSASSRRIRFHFVTTAKPNPAIVDESGHSTLKLTLLLGSLTALGPVSVDMYLPAFPQIAREFGVKDGAVAFTLSVFLLGIAFGQAIYGPVADRFGRKRPLLVGCLLFMLGAIGCALAPSLGFLTAARLFQSLGSAACMVIVRAIVRDLFDELESAKMYSQLMLVMGVAPILAPLAGGQILAFGSWRWIFVLHILIGAVYLVVTARMLPETLPPERRIHSGPVRTLRRFAALLRHRRFIGYALVAGFIAGMLFTYISESSFLFIKLHGVSAQHFGFFFGANAFGLIGASQLNRRLLRRHTPETILPVALAANAVAGLALAVQGATGWGGLPAAETLIFLCLSAMGFVHPNVSAAAMAPFRHEAGMASALFGMIYFLVGGLMGSLVGWLHNGTAVPMTAIIASCAVVALLALHAIDPASDKPHHDVKP